MVVYAAGKAATKRISVALKFGWLNLTYYECALILRRKNLHLNSLRSNALNEHRSRETNGSIER